MGIPLRGVGSPPITRQPAQPAAVTQPGAVSVVVVNNSSENSITACCNGLAQCCNSVTGCLTAVLNALSNWCSHCACSCECDSAASAQQRQQQPATTTSAMSELRQLNDDVLTQQFGIHQTARSGGNGLDRLGDEAQALGCALSASEVRGAGAVTSQPQGGKETPPSKIKFQDSPSDEHEPETCEAPPSYDEATGGGSSSKGHYSPGPLGASAKLVDLSDSDSGDDSD